MVPRSGTRFIPSRREGMKGRGSIGEMLKHMHELRKNVVDCCTCLPVSEANYFKSVCAEIALPLLVVFLNTQFIMRVTINFNDQLSLNTKKIYNVWTEWNLTSEFASIETL